MHGDLQTPWTAEEACHQQPHAVPTKSKTAASAPRLAGRFPLRSRGGGKDLGKDGQQSIPTIYLPPRS
jgi:hypothetical protein